MLINPKQYQVLIYEGNVNPWGANMIKRTPLVRGVIHPPCDSSRVTASYVVGPSLRA